MRVRALPHRKTRRLLSTTLLMHTIRNRNRARSSAASGDGHGRKATKSWSSAPVRLPGVAARPEEDGLVLLR
jgi:hypothetical protein